jgi:nitrite reductase/ring-hydroxylating ferredoxin subunit/uncharacterized membrane protein
MGLHELTERLEHLDVLDGPAAKVSGVASKLFPHGPVKDVLSGVQLGHALHPMLTDIPIGLWISASLLDLLGREEDGPAIERLIALGLVGAAPTAASGLSDWSDTYSGEQRVGLLHAAGNTVAITLFASSLWARRRGRRSLGRVLGLAGAGATMVGGYLGGHLTMSLGVGVDHTAFEHVPADWQAAIDEQGLADGAPRKVEVDGVDVFLLKREGRIMALGNTCTHAGGPLNEGSLEGDCIRCPWHASVFRLDDGSVVHGPARSPQQVYDVRTEEGKVLVRPRPANRD